MARSSHRLLVAGVVVAVGGAASVAWYALRPTAWHGDVPRPDAPTRAIAVDMPPRTAVTGDEVLGINEGIAIGGGGGAERGGLLRSDRMVAGTLTRRARQVVDLGARIVRATNHTFPPLNAMAMERSGWDWEAPDRYFAAAGAAGLDVIVVIGPWPSARTGAYTERYVPEDLDAYATFVRRVVERYDGDGVDDMPGLERPVLAWEIDNEPDLHHGTAPRGRTGAAPDDFETPEQYATVLLTTARAVREADPEAFVLSGGLFRPMAPKGREYLQRVVAVPGVLDAIDGVSLHCYFTEDSLAPVHRTMETARELTPGLPVWITETSVPSDGRDAWVDADWQAGMVAGIVGAFLAEGADRVLWHTLVDPAEPPREGPPGFWSNSLLRTVRDGGVARFEEKPAGAVFRRLAARLAPTAVSSYREIAADGGRLLETDQGWLAFEGAPRVPEGARTVEDLRTGEVGPAGDVAEAPAWIAR